MSLFNSVPSALSISTLKFNNLGPIWDITVGQHIPASNAIQYITFDTILSHNPSVTVTIDNTNSGTNVFYYTYVSNVTIVGFNYSIYNISGVHSELTCNCKINYSAISK